MVKKNPGAGAKLPLPPGIVSNYKHPGAGEMILHPGAVNENIQQDPGPGLNSNANTNPAGIRPQHSVLTYFHNSFLQPV